MGKELGFILKRFLPVKQKLSILSREHGKIGLITNPIEKCHQLWPGMLIAFEFSQLNSNFYLANRTEIIFSPQSENLQDLRWLHQLLEICYYLVPIESPCNEIFNHIQSCFLISKFEKNFCDQLNLIKKLYILKLLELIGFYPQKELTRFLGLCEELTSQSIDFANKQKVESLKNNLESISNNQINIMNSWVLECIKTHPYAQLFKTLTF